MTEAVADLLKKLTNAHEVTQKQIIELQQLVTKLHRQSYLSKRLKKNMAIRLGKRPREKVAFQQTMDSHLDNALNELNSQKMKRPRRL